MVFCLLLFQMREKEKSKFFHQVEVFLKWSQKYRSDLTEVENLV